MLHWETIKVTGSSLFSKLGGCKVVKSCSKILNNNCSYMKRTVPSGSSLASNPARLSMRDSIVRKHRTSLALGSHVQSFFCVKLKDKKIFFSSFNSTKGRMSVGVKCEKQSSILRHLTNLLCSSCAPQAGWPLLSLYMRKVIPFQAGSQHSINGILAKRASPAYL